MREDAVAGDELGHCHSFWREARGSSPVVAFARSTGWRSVPIVNAVHRAAAG